MPFVIPYQDFVDIIDGKKSEVTLKEVPIEDLNKAVGFSYRWLPHKNATAKVTYLPHEFTIETGINADLTCLKAAVKRNPAEFYWMDCLCVPQDSEMPHKLKEITNMRLYYSNFSRVVFVGTLTDPNKPELAEFDVISLKNSVQPATPEQMKRLRRKPHDVDFDDQISLVGEPQVLSEEGVNLVKKINDRLKQGFSLNSWHTRAWTVQEVAVAREMEFMGMLGDQKDFATFLLACDWTRELTRQGLNDHDLLEGLVTPIKMMEKNKLAPVMLHQALSERKAFYAEDMMYAILPLLDETVCGLNYLQMWEKVRLPYQNAMLDFSIKCNPTLVNILTADPDWFGVSNWEIIKKVSPKFETKALVEGNQATLNWTIGDRKITVVLPLAETKVPDAGPTLYGRCPISIQEGHVEETEAWKVHAFIHKSPYDLVY